MISLSRPTPVTSMRPSLHDLSPKFSHSQQRQQHASSLDASPASSTFRLPSIHDLLGSVGSNQQNLTQPSQAAQSNQWYNTYSRRGPADRWPPFNADAPVMGRTDQFSASSQHSTNPQGIKRKFDGDNSEDPRFNEFRRVAPVNQVPPMQHPSIHRSTELQVRPAQVPPNIQRTKFPPQQYRNDWYPAPPQNRPPSDARPSDNYNARWSQVAPVPNHQLSISSSTQHHPYLQPYPYPQSRSPISRSPSPRRPQPYEQVRIPPRGRPTEATAQPQALPSPQSSSTSSSTTRTTTTATTTQPRSFAEVAPQISSLYSTRRKRATAEQLRVLNAVFEVTFFPSTDLRNQLARELGMSARTVQVWFQNKRSAHRSSILRSGGVRTATQQQQAQQQQEKNENDPVQRYREIAQRDAILSGARGPVQGPGGPVQQQQGFARGSDKDRMYGRLLRMPEAALAHAGGEKEGGEGIGRGGSSSSISSGGSSNDARRKAKGDETHISYDDEEFEDDDDEYVE